MNSYELQYEFFLHKKYAPPRFIFMDPMIYFFDCSSPSRHKQEFLPLASASMENILEGIVPLIHYSK